MTTRLLCCVMLMGCTSGAGAAQTVDPIEAAVHDLGRGSEEPDEVLKRLARDPRPAVAALIDELGFIHDPPKGPIREPFKSHPREDEFSHAVWCIRGLQYLTGGVRFRAPTAHRFGEDEEERKYWLTLDDPILVPFYGTWMAQSQTYVAPEDAQQAIIDIWREWYRENGASHRYRPAKTIHDWFF